MRSIFFCLLLLLNSGVYADTQTSSYKIGLSVWTGYPESVRGFKDALAENGLIEGQNVEFLYSKSGGDKKSIAKTFDGLKRLTWIWSTP